MLSGTFLSLTYKDLITLPELPNDLSILQCYNNRLTVLPLLPNTLTYLSCCTNRLTTLPDLPNTLMYLSCSYNNLTSLPKRLPEVLNKLWCHNNQLCSLPEHLPNTLTYLDCSHNYLVKLPKLPCTTGFSKNDNPFLFHDRYAYFTYPKPWINYKILCKILETKGYVPKKFLEVHKVNPLGALRAFLTNNQLKVKERYFCRDITRLCDSY